VNDSGTGLSPEARVHLFEPFFTTKPRGEGTGLGLATVYGIVKQAGGHVAARSAPGAGTTFDIHLPRTQERGTTARPDGALADTRGSETVLVVEDNPQVRNVTVRVLERAGYRVLEAPGGAEALEIHARAEGRVALLLTDVVMPRMNGRQVADELRRRQGALRVLFVSGYVDGLVWEGEDGVDEEILPKPFTPATLLARVRAILDRP
jgi:two-component system cell cycle sensor histidine kinase/response regulator CckA